MGNISSINSSAKNSKTNNNNNNKDFDNFYQVIDYIATYYILTMDFKSLSNLSNKEYCDKLVVITSDIIKNYFNDLQITYLAQRIKSGEEVNELAKENVLFVNKDKLESLDIQNDAKKSIKKKECVLVLLNFMLK